MMNWNVEELFLRIDRSVQRLTVASGRGRSAPGTEAYTSSSGTSTAREKGFDPSTVDAEFLLAKRQYQTITGRAKNQRLALSGKRTVYHRRSQAGEQAL